MSPVVTTSAIALVFGALVGASTPVENCLPGWLVLLLVLLAPVLRRVAGQTAAAGVMACGLGLAGMTLAADARDDALRPPLRRQLDSAFGNFDIESLGPEGPHDPVPARVVLTEDASRTGDLVQLRGIATGIRFGDSWRALPGDGVRLTVAGAVSQTQLSTWVAGRTISATVTFRRPARYLNEGVPDFERALALEGTALLGSVKSGLLVEVEQSGSRLEELAAAARAHVRRAVAQRVASNHVAAAVITAVLIGDRTGLPDEVRTRLQQAGVYHVIAISGGNIAILAGLVLLCLAPLGLRGRPAAAITLIVVAAYAGTVTAGPSVWRAALMAVLALAARVFDHRTPAWHALAVAAALMVAMQPLDVRDPGFVLTFGATAALIEAARRMGGGVTSVPTRARRPPRGVLNRVTSLVWIRWVLPSVAASAAVEVALMPVSALAFARVTSAGIVLNLVAVPLMAVLQGAGLVLALANDWALVADAAARLAAWSAMGIVESARLVELVPWLSWRVPPPALACVAAYYAGAVVMRVARGRTRRAGAAVLVVSGLAIASGHAATPTVPVGKPATTLRLTVFDVGQAESLLLEAPEARSLLIDAGGAPFGGGGFDVGARVLAPALWARGVRSIGALLVTHGDPDHVGGSDAVIDGFAPASLWTGVDVPAHQPTRALLAHARRNGLAVETLRAGAVRAWGKARLRVLNPPEPDWERPRVRNDDSVVLEVLYGDTALLLTGDISEEVERAIVPRLTAARHRILKVAHHGSRTSTAAVLLEAWAPELALISCGRGNRFGHPAAEVIARLEASGARVLRTDRDGQITIETDGHEVKAWTNASGRP
jgi:competence protein ComEC